MLLCVAIWKTHYNEIVVIHNVKGKLKQNINFWKEKLLLADSSRNLVLPILEYGYFFTI